MEKIQEKSIHYKDPQNDFLGHKLFTLGGMDQLASIVTVKGFQCL